MIGFNPTPELRKLLTHHHGKHQSIHIQTKLKLQIKRKTHNKTSLLRIFGSKQLPFESKTLRLLTTNENQLFIVKPKSPIIQALNSTPLNLTMKVLIYSLKEILKDKLYLWKI